MRTFIRALSILLLLVSILTTAQANSGYGEQSTTPNDGIDRYRKGDVLLHVSDDEGRPISRASISYEQTTRDFLFGIASDTVAVFWLEEAGINYAEVFVSWNLTEHPGWVDSTFSPSLLHNLGFVLSGHCLVWMVGSYPGIPGADPWNLPTRVKALKYDELKRQLYDHVYDTVSSYKSSISYWDINEPFWPYADPFHLNTAQWLEIVSLSVQAIKKADPNAKIYMNNIIGDFPDWGYYPLEHMKLLMDKGIDFDAIGLEVYGDGRSPGVPLDEKNYPVISWVSKRLDQFGSLGKPIILTEIDISSEPNEKAQAEWLRDFYTMAFAKPYVKGLAWTFAFDDPFLPNGGLLKRTTVLGEPRQAYYALKNLTSMWLTKGAGITDAVGELQFRGFAGNYSIAVNAEGFEPLNASIHVQEQVENRFEIHLHTKTVSATATTTEERQSIALTSTSAPSTVTPSYAFAISQQQVFVAIVGVLVLSLVVAIAVTRRRHKIQ